MSSEGPRVHFERYGRQIAVQPPYVGDYCTERPCKEWCGAVEFSCERCKGVYCRSHFMGHTRRLVVPRDSWKSVVKRFHVERAAFIQEHGHPAYSQLPFIMASYCRTPDGRRATTPCGYESTACSGDVLGCVRCKFTYCQGHFAAHVVRFVMPRVVLLDLHKQYAHQLDELAERKRRVLKIRILSRRAWE